jgi:hypothetical protein
LDISSVNVEPFPGSLDTVRLNPSASQIDREIDNPSPVPP